MRIRIPEKAFTELEDLVEGYNKVKGDIFHGTIHNQEVALSWDVSGVIEIESDLMELVEKQAEPELTR